MFLNKKKTFLFISISIIFFFLTSYDVKSDSLKVTDGDTIILNGKKIRFSGIDTPELKQTCMLNGKINHCGIYAKKLLVTKIGNNKVYCVKEGRDKYKRILAECFVNNESLSRYLVKSGYAFAYRRYSKKFVKDEDYARVNRKGMWIMNFDYPWDYRKNN